MAGALPEPTNARGCFAPVWQNSQKGNAERSPCAAVPVLQCPCCKSGCQQGIVSREGNALCTCQRPMPGKRKCSCKHTHLSNQWLTVLRTCQSRFFADIPCRRERTDRMYEKDSRKPRSRRCAAISSRKLGSPPFDPLMARNDMSGNKRPD